MTRISRSCGANWSSAARSRWRSSLRIRAWLGLAPLATRRARRSTESSGSGMDQGSSRVTLRFFERMWWRCSLTSRSQANWRSQA